MSHYPFPDKSPPMHQETYQLSYIPVPPPDDHVRRYTALRLLCLKTDPQYFGSTYEASLSITDSQWRDRLNSVDRVTIFASGSRKSPPEKDGGNNDGWAGMVTILSPEFLQSVGESLPELTSEKNVEKYVVVGMWVHPEHRRKGLGRRLIATGMEWVRLRGDIGAQGRKKVLGLEVHSYNRDALSLYRAMGFHIAETASLVQSEDAEKSEKDKAKLWMSYVLDE